MKDSGTPIHPCSIIKPSNFIELHWRSKGVVVELASLEKSNLYSWNQNGFAGHDPMFHWGLQTLLSRVLWTHVWSSTSRSSCFVGSFHSNTHRSPAENPGQAPDRVWRGFDIFSTGWYLFHPTGFFQNEAFPPHSFFKDKANIGKR